MLMVIFLLIRFLLSSIKIGLIAVMANMFPVIVLFGVMGSAIALGICVDHTMHFMVRYRRLMKSEPTHQAALNETIKRESRPILITALALTLGFATLAFSEFPPVALFGSLSATVMLLALFGTFVVMPYMLSATNTRSLKPGMSKLSQHWRAVNNLSR